MLYFNATTKAQLHKLAAQLPQALLLSGAQGAGLLTTAKHLAGAQLAVVVEPMDKEGSINQLKGTISVERIRDLYAECRGKSRTQRVFIIDNANRMSAGAQNAFLKLLEEPAPHVHFILTTHNIGALLPTIISRTIHTHILPITAEQSEDMAYALRLKGVKLQQALFMAMGQPAELARLAANDEYFTERASYMAAAKTFLMGTGLERVQVAFNYAASRDMALSLLQACKNILSHTLQTQPDKDMIKKLSRLGKAYDAILANGNTKLQLIAAMV